MRYCLVGKTPPPFGGVTVYVKRRFNQLVKSGADVEFVSLNSFKSLLLIPFRKFSIIEVNSVNLFVVLFFYFTFQISRCKFVDHNGSRHYHGIKKSVFNWLMLRSGGVLVVNSHLLKNYGRGTKIECICPFIPPTLEDEQSIIKSYPNDILKVMSGVKFFLNSAWKYIPHEDTDLYGISESLRILDSDKKATMILAIAEFNSDEIPLEILSLINKLVNNGQLYLLVGQKELWPLFKVAALSLRLTPTDGDSVSVREALYFRCKVLASDSIERPDGCNLYQYGDLKDLIRKFKELY